MTRPRSGWAPCIRLSNLPRTTLGFARRSSMCSAPICGCLSRPPSGGSRPASHGLRAGRTHPGLTPVDRKSAQKLAQELLVRQTAQRRLAYHLRRPAGTSSDDAQRVEACPEETFWPGMNLDLTGATLVNFVMRDISVVDAGFFRATFSGNASFIDAAF